MLREVLLVLALNSLIKMLEAGKGAPRQQLHLDPPNDRDTHVLACIGHNRTRQNVRLNMHELLLVEAEVSEELGVFLEALGCSLSGIGQEALLLLLWLAS